MKAAEGAGLKAMLVKNVDDILDRAGSFTGVQVHSSESSEISAHPFFCQLKASVLGFPVGLLLVVMKPRSTCCKPPLEKTQRKMKRKHRKRLRA